MFSWRLSIPFTILNVYLWMHGKLTKTKDNTAFMNTMCDMSQFVVIIPVPDGSSATLAYYTYIYE